MASEDSLRNLCCVRHCKRHILFFFEGHCPEKCKCGCPVDEQCFPIRLSCPFLTTGVYAWSDERRCFFLLKRTHFGDSAKVSKLENLTPASNLHIGVVVKGTVIDYSECGVSCEVLNPGTSWLGSVVIPFGGSVVLRGGELSLTGLLDGIKAENWDAASYNATDHNCLHFGVECFNFLTKRTTTPYELARDTIHPVLREACIYEYGLAEVQSSQQLTDHK